MMLLGQIELDLSDCANSEFHARTLYSAYYNVDCVKAACINPTCTIFYLIATMEGKIFFRKCHLKLLLSKYVIIFMQLLCHSFPHWSTCGQYELLFFMMITVLFCINYVLL